MNFRIWTVTLIVTLSLALSGQDASDHDRHKLPTAEELKKLPPDGGPHWNRLVFESSPYLLQHAANPVDWRPWGQEAFKQAAAEDKPIFLSIGYATCHWCHVMERESFEDAEVAALLNKYFIAIKVDREERPDIDDIYMTACQVMTGSGGWPLTAVLDHEKRPFFTGTYFPKKKLYNRPGMMELLPKIAEVWRDQRAQLLDQAVRITDYLQSLHQVEDTSKLSNLTLTAAYQQLNQRFDATHGGFGSAPKFPTPHNLTFLLRCWRRSGDAKALEMVTKTLRAIRAGGIFDHVGFGFHRYATDAQWLLPHFEKMLYDQAQLAIAYLETHQATGDPFFAETAREIFTYVLRDMTAPEGGFYSAEDADSEGEEGKFYLWTHARILEILGPKEGALFVEAYNIKPEGNFQHESGGIKITGENIPHLQKPLSEIAATMKITEKALSARLESARQKLFDLRERRIHPLKDDKILTDWNGLMIAAFARGARVLDEPKYAEAAEKAALFLLSELRTEKGRLLKRHRAGKAGLPAHLDDYAFFVWGLLELYEATFNTRYLQEAVVLNDEMINHFWDGAQGGFFFTAGDGELLITRSKPYYDGAVPSGNSVGALNLIKLGRITAKGAYAKLADQLFLALSAKVSKSPSGFTQLLGALDFSVGPSFEVVLVGDPKQGQTQTLIRELFRVYQPNKIVVFRPEGEKPAISEIAAYTREQKSLAGKATAYVCRNYACEKPTTDPAEMIDHFKK